MPKAFKLAPMEVSLHPTHRTPVPTTPPLSSRRRPHHATPGRWLALLLIALSAAAAANPTLDVAVAANFTTPAEQIAQNFTARTGVVVHISSGASGVLYAQIKNGAPFEVLLAADDVIPTQLCQEGLARCSSQLTYARGHLVLWSKDPHLVDPDGRVLTRPLSRLALADPQTAPYGRAAVET